MEAAIHDLLLFISVAVPPVVLGYLFYLGLQISEHDQEPASIERARPRKSLTVNFDVNARGARGNRQSAGTLRIENSKR